MLPVLEQLFILFAFLLVGYLLGKTKTVNSAHVKILSALEVYVFLPSTIVNSFSKNFSLSNLRGYFLMIAAAVGVLLINVVISHLLSGHFAESEYDLRVYRYSFITTNYGYMGNALAEGMFGSTGLLNFIIFTIPISFYTYTVGYAMLTKRKLSFKALLNPVTIALCLGMLLGLCSVPLPSAVSTLLGKSAGCLAPVAMLLTGITISEFQVGKLFCSKKAYLFSVLRLFVFPLLLGFALRPLLGVEVAQIAVLYYAMPCGMNTILFAKLVGEDCRTSSALVLISNILCIVTIPLVMAIPF